MYMFIPKLIKPPILLNTFSTFASRFMISWINPMIVTKNIMINIGCHMSFKLVTRFGFICRRNALLESIKSFNHFDMGFTSSTRLLVIMILS